MTKYAGLYIERPRPMSYGAPRNSVHVMQEGQFVSLTDLWRSACIPTAKGPEEWAATTPGDRSIAAIKRELGGHESRVWSKWDIGRGDTINAHWKVALAYANYLGPEFHRAVVHNFREWAVGMPGPPSPRNVALENAFGHWAADRPGMARPRSSGREEDAYLARGFSPRWAALRVAVTAGRRSLVAELTARGYRIADGRNPVAEVTNEVYLAVLGLTAREFREKKGLARSAHIRDHLNARQLEAVRFLESLIERQIVAEGADHPFDCIDCAEDVADQYRSHLSGLASTKAIADRTAPGVTSRAGCDLTPLMTVIMAGMAAPLASA